MSHGSVLHVHVVPDTVVQRRGRKMQIYIKTEDTGDCWSVTEEERTVKFSLRVGKSCNVEAEDVKSCHGH